jgi:hypothetical protein
MTHRPTSAPALPSALARLAARPLSRQDTLTGVQAALNVTEGLGGYAVGHARAERVFMLDCRNSAALNPAPEGDGGHAQELSSVGCTHCLIFFLWLMFWWFHHFSNYSTLETRIIYEFWS